METIENNIDKFKGHVAWGCDVLLLSTCSLTLAFIFFFGADIYLFGLLVNCILVLAFKIWITKQMGIHWLLSPLNRILKRIVDIFISLLFLTTLFPLLLFVHTLATKIKGGKEVISFCKMRTFTGRLFYAPILEGPFFPKKQYIRISPLAINVLFGTISLWDFASLQECGDDINADDCTFYKGFATFINKTSAENDGSRDCSDTKTINNDSSE